jgi:hypothetical protein
MAEEMGFEPMKGVNPCRFSRPVHSTALPPLQGNGVAAVKQARIVTMPACFTKQFECFLLNDCRYCLCRRRGYHHHCRAVVRHSDYCVCAVLGVKTTRGNVVVLVGQNVQVVLSAVGRR